MNEVNEVLKLQCEYNTAMQLKVSSKGITGSLPKEANYYVVCWQSTEIRPLRDAVAAMPVDSDSETWSKYFDDLDLATENYVVALAVGWQADWDAWTVKTEPNAAVKAGGYPEYYPVTVSIPSGPKENGDTWDSLDGIVIDDINYAVQGDLRFDCIVPSGNNLSLSPQYCVLIEGTMDNNLYSLPVPKDQVQVLSKAVKMNAKTYGDTTYTLAYLQGETDGGAPDMTRLVGWTTFTKSN
jgi:hypothetical protein